MLTQEKQDKHSSQEQEVRDYENGSKSVNMIKFSNQEQMKAFNEF